MIRRITVITKGNSLHFNSTACKTTDIVPTFALPTRVSVGEKRRVVILILKNQNDFLVINTIFFNNLLYFW